jgi:hypothetical protein
LGATTVTITATDAAGNTGTGTFTVTVRDTTAPVLVMPVNVVTEAASPAGAIVTYSAASATDSITASPALTYSKQSGTLFPVGLTIVTVTATDLAGNKAAATFSVLVNASNLNKSAPVVDITAPTGNAVPGEFIISGTLKLSLALQTFTVKLNGVPLVLDSPLSFAAGAVETWKVSGVAPENGTNLIVVEAEDFAGKKASATKRVIYTNRRSELAGTYAAVLVPETDPDIDRTGFVSVTVTPSGSFSGKLLINRVSAPFSGILGNDGVARFKQSSGITLDLLDKTRHFLGTVAFSVTEEAGMSGTLSSGSVLAAFAGKKAPYGPASPVPIALLNLPSGSSQGVYDLVFQAPVLATTPQGDGHARIILKKTGVIRVSGYLADGTKYVAAGNLRADQTVPLFTALYKKGGAFSGELAFADVAGSEVSGVNLLWLRPAGFSATYQAGWPEGLKVTVMGTKAGKSQAAGM